MPAVRKKTSATVSPPTETTEQNVAVKEMSAGQVATVAVDTQETTMVSTATENQKTEPTQKEPAISFPTADFSGSKKSGKGRVVATIVVILIALGAIVGGSFFYYTQKTQNANGGPTEEAGNTTPSPVEATPTPEETGNIDFSEYSAQVLNGSGIGGEAGKVEALLEKAGMEDIKTGNAKTYDFTDTEVQVAADSPTGLYEAVQKALVGYSVKKGVDLSEDSEFDMIITVGSKKSSTTEE
ncbi:MAG: LytR C-terminal domain-containing protein [Candidatus Blackburnbacteria bacterium]|nr:LytR C-terminal domain-containing protein [Candidatus Blackburnbacteria bacterium]